MSAWIIKNIIKDSARPWTYSLSPSVSSMNFKVDRSCFISDICAAPHLFDGGEFCLTNPKLPTAVGFFFIPPLKIALEFPLLLLAIGCVFIPDPSDRRFWLFTDGLALKKLLPTIGIKEVAVAGDSSGTKALLVFVPTGVSASDSLGTDRTVNS